MDDKIDVEFFGDISVLRFPRQKSGLWNDVCTVGRGPTKKVREEDNGVTRNKDNL